MSSEMSIEDLHSELEKCKKNPYYFATKYCTINGKPFVTHLSEEEFNSFFMSVKLRLKSRNYHGRT